MSAHLSSAKLKHFVAGNFPLEEIAEISTHLAQCQNCKRNLAEIAPDFIKASLDEPDSQDQGNLGRHFSDGEIYSFLRAEPTVERRMEMSDHFRICGACKVKLYETDPSILKETVSDILGEDELEENEFFFTKKINSLVSVSAIALILIGLFSFLFYNNQRVDRAGSIAKVSESVPLQEEDIRSKSKSDPPINENKPGATANTADPPAAQPGHTRIPSNNNSAKKPVKRVKSSPRKKNVNSKPRKSVGNPGKTKPPVQIAESRSANDSGSSVENRVLIDYPKAGVAANAKPTFRWKPVKDAIGYDLYVSDDSQILIEEAKGVTKTSYRMKSSLKPDKSYRLRIIANLPEGKTTSSASVSFRVVKKKNQDPK